MTLSIIRELCKDAEDIKGDAVSNLHTFPRKYGLINTLWFIRFLSLLLCLISIIPFIHGNYGIFYLIILIIGVIIPLLYGTLFFLNNESLSYKLLEHLKPIFAVRSVLLEHLKPIINAL